MKKLIVFLFIVTTIIILAASFIPFVSERMQMVSHVATAVMVFIQVLALIVIKQQLKLQEYLNVANFTLQATRELREHVTLFEKIKDSETPDLSNAEIMSALNIYENISLIIDKGAIDFKDIDGPFAYRFFKVCNHPQIQNMELIKDGNYYKSIYRLHRKWLEYRDGIGVNEEEPNLLKENNEKYGELSA